MGIGRRNFLKLTTLALAGTFVDPLQAVAVNDNFYVNKKLGVLFEKPSSWDYIHVKDFGLLKQSQILSDNTSLSAEEIWDDLGDPICMVTKYHPDLPGYTGIFSPTVTVHVTPKSEMDELGITEFEAVMKESEVGISQILKDFKRIRRYEPYFISGVEFHEFDSEYLFEHIDIKTPLKVELKTIKALNNGFYYDFNMHQSTLQNQVAGIEFEKFKKSIRLI